MTITATDFQLSVNEYFTKLMQGEEIIIERYGKKFAVLVPFETYEKSQDLHSDKLEQKSKAVVQQPLETDGDSLKSQGGEQVATVADASEKLLTPEELTKLVKLLLA